MTEKKKKILLKITDWILNILIIYYLGINLLIGIVVLILIIN